jgi:single-strand DNA-binding protein
MSSLNQVIFMGNLTRDVEMRYTPSGTAVGQCGIAMNRKWKDKNTNEMKEEVTFVDLVIWGHGADFVAKYFRKGSPILVTGRMKNERWTDKQTNTPRQKLVCVVDEARFCGDTKKDGQAGTQKAQGTKQQAPANDQPPEDLEIQEENIPF